MQISKTTSSYFTLEKLSEGIYAAIAKEGEGAMSNSGFIDLGNEVIIFDTFTTPKAARDLRKLAEEITQKNIKYVFNSHYHGDHTFGNQVFEEELHMNKNVLLEHNKEKEDTEHYLIQLKQRMMIESDPILLKSIDTQYKEVRKVCDSIPELRIVLPNLTFEDKLVIHGSSRTVEFYCYGGGHTPSDAFLYLPEEKIAFMGDIVLENRHPPIYNSQDFIDNLTKVNQLDIQTIIPGHGSIVTKEQINVMIQYLEHLNWKVNSLLRKNKTFEQILSTVAPEEYAKWTGIDGYKRNLSIIYNEQKENLN